MRKEASAKQTYTRALIILLVAVIVVTGGLLAIGLWERGQGEFDEQPEMSAFMEVDGKRYVPRKNLETVLVMGLDKFGDDIVNDSYNNDQQADFLMLLVFDKQQSTCTALHINRDTMAPMGVLGVAGEKVDTVTRQIALAHTYGNGREASCRNTAQAVSALLGNVRVDRYVSMTMDAVAAFNDLVDGVQVTIQDDLTAIDPAFVKGETVTLRGEQALRFVRTRYDLEDSSNATRMLRQRQYLDALYQKTAQKMREDDDFAASAALDTADHIVSNCTAHELQELLEKMEQYTLSDIRALEGNSVQGEVFMEFYPDKDALQKTVVDMFYQPQE